MHRMLHSLLRDAGMHAQVAQVVQVTQVAQGQGRDTGKHVFNVQLRVQLFVSKPERRQALCMFFAFQATWTGCTITESQTCTTP